MRDLEPGKSGPSRRSLRDSANMVRTARLRAGAVAVELALTLPIVILFGLCGADLARVIYFQQVVANACRTAAERGATQRFTEFTRLAWEDDVRQAALDELQNVPGFSEDAVDYELSTTTDADGVVHVAIEIALPFHTIAAWPMLSAEVQLHRRLEFRQFR